MLSTFVVFNSSTPLRIVISSSRRGSSPVRWNWRNVFNSAFLYVCCSFVPKTISSNLAIGHAMGARIRWGSGNSQRCYSSYQEETSSRGQEVRILRLLIDRTERWRLAEWFFWVANISVGNLGQVTEKTYSLPEKTVERGSMRKQARRTEAYPKMTGIAGVSGLSVVYIVNILYQWKPWI